MIARLKLTEIRENMDLFPIVAILGPRQCGKTILAKQLGSTAKEKFHYLDLELDSDVAKLDDAESYLRSYQDKCVIIDEIQRMPRVFPLLRALVDEHKRPSRFMLLGSSSTKLIKGSSESLAGRIAFTELAPFSLMEIGDNYTLSDIWFKGGLPDSLLKPSIIGSKRWLGNYVKSLSEIDLVEQGISLPPIQIRKLLTMLAYYHGNILNLSELANSMGLSQPSLRKYVDILEGSFLIRQLQPYYININKRLVKSPKIFFRDSGLLHYLLNIPDLDSLYGNPAIGNSWEGFVIEEIAKNINEDWQMYYYRTHGGAETDLVLIDPMHKKYSIEIKLSAAPKISKGFYESTADIMPDEKYVITTTSETYTKSDGTFITDLKSFLNKIKNVSS